MSIRLICCKECGENFYTSSGTRLYCDACRYREHHFVCACGCGQMVKYIGLIKYKSTYIQGHQNYNSEYRLNHSLRAKKLQIGKWMTGKKLSEETKLKIRESKLGEKRTEESKKKVSLANSGENNGMYGRKHTQAAKLKISQAAKEMWKNKEFLVVKSQYLTSEYRRDASRRGAFSAQSKIRHMGFKDTRPEILMKKILDSLNVEYKHSYPIKDIPHMYFADFFIPNLNLIIEVDGVYWHNFPFGRELDRIRNVEILQHNYKLLRFWEGTFDSVLVQSALSSINIININNVNNMFYLKESESLDMTGKAEYYKFLKEMEDKMQGKME